MNDARGAQGRLDLTPCREGSPKSTDRWRPHMELEVREGRHLRPALDRGRRTERHEEEAGTPRRPPPSVDDEVVDGDLFLSGRSSALRVLEMQVERVADAAQVIRRSWAPLRPFAFTAICPPTMTPGTRREGGVGDRICPPMV